MIQLPDYRPGNRLITGSTRSGKSTAEVIEIMIAALCAAMSIVVIDPHEYSLAWNAFVQLVAHGQGRRVLFDRLSNLKRVLGYRFLRPSHDRDPNQRKSENEQTTREFGDVLIRRRDMASLAGNPLTEEFLNYALDLIQYQKPEVSAAKIEFAFQPEHPEFKRLLRNCTSEEVKAKFRAIADGTIKPGMYASASRLIRSVCRSPAFTLRCQPTFDLYDFLDNRGILLVEGSSKGISGDTASMIMSAIILQVINYIRWRRSSRPGLLLVMDEATNANLIGNAGHEVHALAELQKKGLDVHILVQSPTFGNSFIEDGILTNCVEHHWYFAANDAVAQKAARDLGSPDFRERVRGLRRGQRYVKRLTKVNFEQVTPLPDPWPFPGLAEKKARTALGEIMKRPEYWSPSTCDESPTVQQEPNESSTLPKSMSSPQDTSSEISAAKRLRIAQQKDSDPTGN